MNAPDGYDPQRITELERELVIEGRYLDLWAGVLVRTEEREERPQVRSTP